VPQGNSQNFFKFWVTGGEWQVINLLNLSELVIPNKNSQIPPPYLSYIANTLKSIVTKKILVDATENIFFTTLKFSHVAM
tara:strand:+ start:60 stop:299 length:240 start_codon:yes stop_codon:yes gene_type:complete